MSKSGAFLQDLIDQILVLLPLKSLLRFRCVSKWFSSTIHSQHLVKSRFRGSSGKLIELQAHKSGEEFRAFEFGNDFQREPALVKPMYSRRQQSGYSYCKGLVLLHMLDSEVSQQDPSLREFTFSLWNPSTGEYWVLPELPVKYPWDSDHSFGLGYDSTTDDYKAVVFTPGEGWDSQVWTFTLKSNCWRRIRDGENAYFPLVGLGAGNRDGFVDDALHFVCQREDEESYMIVSFDVANETFSEVKKPDCRPFFDGDIHLNVIGGSLAISFFYYRDDRDRIDQVDTYIQKKDGNDFNWTRLYNVTEGNFEKEVFKCFSRGKHAYSREGDRQGVLFG